MLNSIELLFRKSERQAVILIDPDKQKTDRAAYLAKKAYQNGCDFIFVGGSLVSSNIDDTITAIKKEVKIPIILFLGSPLQISKYADGILLLSLISGRNPELLIGHHVISAKKLKDSALQIIPTAYMLFDCGNPTSVEYISNTRPIPNNKTDIAVSTALAGEMLGLRQIYLEAGSGANKTVSADIISAVKKNTSVPLIVGGGIRNIYDVNKVLKAGADIIILGSVWEKNEEQAVKLLKAIKNFDKFVT